MPPDGHVAGLVQLLDAGQQARGLRLDGHVAILQHSLNRNLAAFYLDVGSVGNLRDVQLLSDLRANLSGITVDSLTAAEYDVVLLHANLLDSCSQDLGGSEGIGTAELTSGNQNAFVSTASHQLTQHALCRGRTHGDNNDLAAGSVLQLQSSLYSVLVVRVDDGLPWMRGSECHRD